MMNKAPALGVDRWHARFLQQAGWTRQVRRYLAGQLGISNRARILEAGCGTGAITADLWQDGPSQVYGLDLSPAFLRKASGYDPRTLFSVGDVYRLPYADKSFDLSVAHFLLLWLERPLDGLREMMRVTCPGGNIVLFAEPDYPARIDYPLPLARLGALQEQALKRQGAHPEIGRTIASLLVRAGCVDVHSGLMGGQWSAPADLSGTVSEHEILRADLSGNLSENELDDLLSLDLKAWEEGWRVLFVPTFYAWGKIP